MEIIKKIEENCIRIDWKEGISDTFFLMKKSWPSLNHMFDDKDFQSLIENYNAEMPEDYLPAIGQELTSFGYCLFDVYENTDQYCLIAIPAEESGQFIRETKKAKLKITRQKQPCKKIGSKARRIKLADQILHEKTILKGWYTLRWPLTVTTLRFYNNTGAFSHESSYIANLEHWPPELKETEKISRLAYNDDKKIWAAIFVDPETKKSKLKVGHNPWDGSGWTEVDFPGELHSLSSLFWIDDDLLILREKTAWLLESVSSGTLACTFLYESSDHTHSVKQGIFPKLIQTNTNKRFILFFTQIYEWKNKQLKPTGIYVEKHTEFNTFTTGEDRFVYIADYGRLVEVDIKRKKTRSRNLINMDAASIQKYNDHWAVLFRYGYPNKDIPIAQFWNPKTDEWKELKLGAFGKHGIRDLLVTPGGDVLIRGEKDTLIKVQNFDRIFSSSKYDISNANAWSEDWDD